MYAVPANDPVKAAVTMMNDAIIAAGPPQSVNWNIRTKVKKIHSSNATAKMTAMRSWCLDRMASWASAARRSPRPGPH